MKNKFSLLLLLSLISLYSWALPARKGGHLVTLSDGSTMTVYLHGDEYFHWMTNEKGEWIERNANGDFEVIEALTEQEIAERRKIAPRYQINTAQKASELNIAPRGLIILVNFSDKAFTTNKAEIDSMINGENYTRQYNYVYNRKNYSITSEGSARKYFEDVSFGQYKPQFDVIGPVTLTKTMATYGANDSYGNDKNPMGMVAEACRLVDDSVDFTLYDNNNDGEVDFVYVFYAGYGEADGGGENTIWPHQYFVGYYQTVRLDGKKINRYACSNEISYYSKKHDGIGPFCHEFSHVLGLPDLYTTNGSSHRTMVDWDIMDYGPYNNDSNTPPSYSAYERFFMGWLQPRLINQSEIITLNELQENNEALLISKTGEHNLIGNNPNPTTFYILENRQKKGWDKYLPGHGMMLTKVMYSTNMWNNNTVNNTATRMGVDLIEADDITGAYGSTNYWGKPSDLFPTGATEYLGIENYPIKDIQENDSIITFNFMDAILSHVENTQEQEEIIAIYNILGQRISTQDIHSLEQGTYIIKTTTETKKIIIR